MVHTPAGNTPSTTLAAGRQENAPQPSARISQFQQIQLPLGTNLPGAETGSHRSLGAVPAEHAEPPTALVPPTPQRAIGAALPRR